MKGWVNTRPEEEGYFWVVKKYFIDGELQETSRPDIWHIDPNGQFGCCQQLGTDDPDEIPEGDELVTERVGPLEHIFGWDTEEVAIQKRRNMVTRRWEYWLKPIPQAHFDKKFPVDEYPETHQEGILSIHKAFSTNQEHHCDLGLQVSPDGRIWLCVNGEAYIRFKPMSKATYETLYLAAVKAAVVKEKVTDKDQILEICRKYMHNRGKGKFLYALFDESQNLTHEGCGIMGIMTGDEGVRITLTNGDSGYKVPSGFVMLDDVGFIQEIN